MFVANGLHPASCELRGEGDVWLAGAWVGKLKTPLLGLSNLGFVWGKCRRLRNLLQRGQRPAEEENGSALPI